MSHDQQVHNMIVQVISTAWRLLCMTLVAFRGKWMVLQQLAAALTCLPD